MTKVLMTKVLASLTLLLFPLCAIACNETDQPKLILETISEHDSGCTSFYVITPNTFNGTEIESVLFSSENPSMQFRLEAAPDKDLNLAYSIICVNQTLLSKSELTLYYREPVGADGGMRLCLDEYKYTDLLQYVIKEGE
ncbi:hypothetical protein [Kangiella sediminilitoris]|uniref:Lipoprotein n=1 Tax=Kangiella sediminilitoris TaxID=1144748 RepID=A0A1B3BCN1_9GAMM|nr:hypothetical protein [Kangiella sediminilitoris]AOE50576.1 hypothetical protein KS2013_1867 [Kangiella sediminilitoris]